MLHSNATKYAIRALCYLAALPPGTSAQTGDIARELNIPKPFLAKILQGLARRRILASTRGPAGGFRMAADPGDTTLHDLVEAVEGPPNDEECILGFEICSEDAVCPVHEMWKDFRDKFRHQMRTVTLADLVAAGERKNQLLR